MKLQNSCFTQFYKKLDEIFFKNRLLMLWSWARRVQGQKRLKVLAMQLIYLYNVNIRSVRGIGLWSTADWRPHLWRDFHYTKALCRPRRVRAARKQTRPIRLEANQSELFADNYFDTSPLIKKLLNRPYSSHSRTMSYCRHYPQRFYWLCSQKPLDKQLNRKRERWASSNCNLQPVFFIMLVTHWLWR